MSTYLKSSAIAARASCVMSRCSGRFCFRIALVSRSLPRSIDSSRRSLLNHCRILLRARALLTKCCQSWLGPAPSALEVKISTQSPWFSSLLSGTSLPLTRAPMVRWPTSVWTA